MDSKLRGDDTACQVIGCEADLKNLKVYYKRYKICEVHSKLLSWQLGGVTSRWCQQCGKFQPLEEFEAQKRTCKRKLSQHNSRRRDNGMQRKNFQEEASESKSSILPIRRTRGKGVQWEVDSEDVTTTSQGEIMRSRSMSDAVASVPDSPSEDTWQPTLQNQGRRGSASSHSSDVVRSDLPPGPSRPHHAHPSPSIYSSGGTINSAPLPDFSAVVSASSKKRSAPLEPIPWSGSAPMSAPLPKINLQALQSVEGQDRPSSWGPKPSLLGQTRWSQQETGLHQADVDGMVIDDPPAMNDNAEFGGSAWEQAGVMLVPDMGDNAPSPEVGTGSASSKDPHQVAQSSSLPTTTLPTASSSSTWMGMPHLRALPPSLSIGSFGGPPASQRTQSEGDSWKDQLQAIPEQELEAALGLTMQERLDLLISMQHLNDLSSHESTDGADCELLLRDMMSGGGGMHMHMPAPHPTPNHMQPPPMARDGAMTWADMQRMQQRKMLQQQQALAQQQRRAAQQQSQTLQQHQNRQSLPQPQQKLTTLQQQWQQQQQMNQAASGQQMLQGDYGVYGNQAWPDHSGSLSLPSGPLLSGALSGHTRDSQTGSNAMLQHQHGGSSTILPTMQYQHSGSSTLLPNTQYTHSGSNTLLSSMQQQQHSSSRLSSLRQQQSAPLLQMHRQHSEHLAILQQSGSNHLLPLLQQTGSNHQLPNLHQTGSNNVFPTLQQSGSNQHLLQQQNDAFIGLHLGDPFAGLQQLQQQQQQLDAFGGMVKQEDIMDYSTASGLPHGMFGRGF